MEGRMMHYCTITRPDLCGNYPTVFTEIRRQDHIGVFDRPFGRYLISLRHLHNQIRLTDAPPFHEDSRSWRVLRIAFRGTVVHPRRQFLDVRRTEGDIVAIMLYGGVRKPWR